jgi:hypothetical protein
MNEILHVTFKTRCNSNFQTKCVHIQHANTQLNNIHVFSRSSRKNCASGIKIYHRDISLIITYHYENPFAINHVL